EVGSMLRTFTHIAVALVLLSFTPLTALAQRESAALVGTVRDASGLVMPGVTVEVTSPVLIERSKSTQTDEQGRFRVVDLRPGTYAVTFTLDGFARVTHEDITLPVGFTATVDADMKTAAIEETVVVSGQSPVVDVQNTARRSSFDRRFLETVPSGRLYTNVVALIPGVVLASTSGAPQDVGGTNGQANASFAIHGGRMNDAQVQIDGMSVAGLFNNAGTTMMFPNEGSVEEYSIALAAQSAESEVGGIRVNIVPREGDSHYRGGFFGNFTNGALQSQNVTDDLTRRGLRAPNRVKQMHDVNPTIGGPLVPGRLSFFAASRRTLAERYVGGLYYNRTPDSFIYAPDLTRQAVEDQPGWDVNGRVTWQVSNRHKIKVYTDYTELCSCHNFISPTRAPEASWRNESKNRLVQVAWTSPMRSELLFEAGASILLASQDRTPAEGSFGPPIVD